MFGSSVLMKLARHGGVAANKFGAPGSWSSRRCVHLTSLSYKDIRVKGEKIHIRKEQKMKIQEGEKMGIEGMKGVGEFPDAGTMDRIFNGIPYKQLPILNVKATPNNTIMSFTNADGNVLMLHSAGMEGFKNAKKGSNVAAQQTALTLGTKIVNAGTRTVRLTIQGLGNGRGACLKGFMQAGIEIVSITDETRISWNPPRPRKARRI